MNVSFFKTVVLKEILLLKLIAVSGKSGARFMCNHGRASKYFTESISPKVDFTSFPCENNEKFQTGECFDCKSGKYCGKMGYYSDQSKGRGSYYLLTQPEKPFHGRILIDKKVYYLN